MQSLRQSRHLLSAVKAQVERDQERARLRTLDAEDNSEPAATATAAPNDDDSADPEKAAQDEDSRNHRRPSAESAPRPSLSSASSDGSSSSEVLDGVSNAAQRVTTACTQYTAGAALGHSLTGVHARDRLTHEGKGDKVFVVGWEGPDDPLNPRNWTVSTGWSRLAPGRIYTAIAVIEYLTTFVRALGQAAGYETKHMGGHLPGTPPPPSENLYS